MTPHENRSKKALSAPDITATALFAALIAICAWISVPAAVPFTMQTFGVFFTAGILGGKRGTAAVAVYILMGIAGLPVFAGFRGGAAVLAGPTGGYIAGFILSALIMWAFEAAGLRTGRWLILSMLTGLLTCYIFGTAWFMTVYTAQNGELSLMSALTLCVFPYVIPDVIKIALAAGACRRLRPALNLL